MRLANRYHFQRLLGVALAPETRATAGHLSINDQNTGLELFESIR
jgi:hypothetical protein